MLAIPRVKPLGWVDDEQLTAAQITQMDLNISLLDGEFATVWHADVSRWGRTDLNVGTSSMTLLSAVQQVNGIGTAANRQKQILVAGSSPLTAPPEGALLNDGTVAPASLDAFAGLAGASLNSAPASDDLGTIFVGFDDGFVVKSTDGLAICTPVTVTGMTTGADWVGFTDNTYLVFERSTNKLYSAPSLISGPWTATVTSFDIIRALVTDGAGLWVLVGHQVGGAIHVLRSTDDGATWDFSNPSGSGAPPTGLGAAWSQANGCFVMIDSNGRVWTSVDADTWTIVRTVALLAAATMATPWGQNAVAACGPVIACLANRGVNALGKYDNGIAYTLDLGATWNEVYFGSADVNAPLTNLISANGRLYAIDGEALYQSGVLESPPAVFTGV
jgi:hypothetical protein